MKRFVESSSPITAHAPSFLTGHYRNSPKLANPRTVSIPKTTFRPVLGGHQALMAKSSCLPRTFRPDGPKQLSPDTLVRYRDVAWRTASAQVHQGRPAAGIVGLAALLDYDWLYRAMAWFHARAGNKFLKDHLNIAATWLWLLRRQLRAPAGDDPQEHARGDLRHD